MSDLKSNDFQRVMELFEVARTKHGADREALLQQTFGGSPDIISEVRRLLADHENENGPLDSPIVPDFAQSKRDLENRVSPPERIEHYHIVRQLGAGGMGTVYLAQQDNPRRNVAVKVIRPGLFSRELQHRFELEAAVLGRLQHSGIAQIYEAGLFDDGLNVGPYFAMEFVDGLPLNEYVRQHVLSAKDRLNLIIQICDAVHHAHQRGVIHRDLKPGNIVVDKTGQPKILDFGVARATDSDMQATTHCTDIGQLIGTLPYMSPEQAGGRPHDVDTLSDVYALGVILYELLAERLPYDLSKATIVTAAKMITETIPAPLSTISKAYRGDLNTIVLKALEKQPRDRYQSAFEFATDIRHFLANETIVARPQTTWYQARKFAGRHRALVGGLAAVFVVLLSGIAATAWQANQAARQRDQAAEQATRANETAALLSRMILSVTPENARGHEPTMRQMLEEFSRELRADRSIAPEVAADTHRILGNAYLSLGQYDLAEQHAKLAIALHTQVAGPDSLDTLMDQMALAMIFSRLDRDAEANTMAGHVLERARLLYEPTDKTLIGLLNSRGHILGAAPDADQNEVAGLYRECYEKSLRKFGDHHSRTLVPAMNLGVTLVQLGQLDEGERLLRHVHDVRLKIYGNDHPETLLASHNISLLLQRKGDLDGAAQLSNSQLELAEKVLGEDHPRTIFYRLNVAKLEFQLGQLDAAVVHARAALSGALKRLGPTHQNTVEARGILVNILLELSQTEEAESLAREQQQLCAKEFGPQHPHTVQAATLLFDLAETRGDLAQMRLFAEQLQGTEWEQPAQKMIRQMEARAVPD